MGFVEKWNNLAKKNLYINKTFEIGMGRVMYMAVINCFLSVGLLLTSSDPIVGIIWLWGDMVGSFKRQDNSD